MENPDFGSECVNHKEEIMLQRVGMHMVDTVYCENYPDDITYNKMFV
jgi:hypothetical protein